MVAGLSYLKKSEYGKALDYLDEFSANDALLGPSIIAAKAACKSGLGDLEKAASLYEKAARLGDNEYTSVYFQKAGVHYELTKTMVLHWLVTKNSIANTAQPEKVKTLRSISIASKA